MRNVLIFILLTNLLTGFSQEKKYTLSGKFISCSEYKDRVPGVVKLYKDSIEIDSINTYRSAPDFLGGWVWTTSRFKFKGLTKGKYEIRYHSHFDAQDCPTIIIDNENIKNLELCLNKLPERVYQERTMLDNLTKNDTLFINVYIASGGEFGGYDEGLWITKKEEKFYGRFYRLPNTYALQLDRVKVENTYRDNKSKIIPLTEYIKLDETTIIALRKFLIELNHYHDSGISNAPEHFLIYTRNEKIYRIKNNFEYQPYLKLREKIKNCL